MKSPFTAEEKEAVITQLGARIDHLLYLQKVAAKEENIPRVIELENYIVLIRTARDKISLL